ncbi:hypothetical protein QBC41DRAFT_347312 [Cercophora samala]|uniref:Uncharacterized protein n=1 Tax=Cercophora samala TaxID=330535 RepID=A0AA40D9I5_9PEZI|nr:hypothetical protein QBC41DRAFT_347312 [Cercophora samala]
MVSLRWLFAPMTAILRVTVSAIDLLYNPLTSSNNAKMASTSTPPKISNYSRKYLPKRKQIPLLKVYPPPQLPEPPHNQLEPFERELDKDDTQKRVLFLIPTKNRDKVEILTAQFKKRLPENTVMHYISFSGAPSGVGEQPYNEAGMIGAFNRIDHAVFITPAQAEISSFITEHRITTVIFAAIESFIARPGWPPVGPGKEATREPVDYAYILLYNPVTGAVKTGVSEGVEVPWAYYREAQEYGFGDPDNEELFRMFGEESGLTNMPEGAEMNHGKVTVGEIMAHNIRGLDKQNWQKLLTDEKACRYRLIEDALAKMEIPW